MELNCLAVGQTQERLSVERETFGLVWIYTGYIRSGVDLHVRHSVWCGSTRETFGLVWIYTGDIRSGVDLHGRHSVWCGSTRETFGLVWIYTSLGSFMQT